jgi:superfamily II DNA or RNA helicase
MKMTPRSDLVPLRPGFTARPWQTDAARSLATHARLGTSRMLISAATGCGKGDLIAAMMVKAVWQGRRVGFAVHRDFLLSDVYERALQIEPALYAGRVVSRINEPDRHAVFMSLQTVRSPDRVAPVGRLDWLFVDEAHFFMCPSGFSALTTLTEANPSLRVLGFTATPFRAAGNGKTTGLGPMFGPDVGGLDSAIYEYSLADGINDGVLSPMEALRLPPLYERAPTDEDGKRIAELLDTDAHNDAVVEAYLKHRAPGIAFCASVPHAIHLAERFKLAGVRAEAVWDSSSAKDPTTQKPIGADKDRDRKIAAIQSGDLEVVTNLDLLSTGFDCRRLEVMMSVRPTGSPGLFAQQVGRVTRLSPETGKVRGLVLDFVDNTLAHNLAFEADLSSPEAKVRTVDMGDIVRHRHSRERAEGLVIRTEEDGRVGIVEWRGFPTDRHSADDLILIRKRSERETISVVPSIKGLQEFPVLLIRGDQSTPWYPYRPSGKSMTYTTQAWLPEGEARMHVTLSDELWDVWLLVRGQAPRMLWSAGKTPEDAMEWAAGWLHDHDGRIEPVKAAWKTMPSTPQQHGFLRHLGKTANLERLSKGEASALGAALSAIRDIGDHLDPRRVHRREAMRLRHRHPAQPLVAS